MKRIKSDRIITPKGILAGYVYFEDERIVEVSERDVPVTEEYDATGLYVSPRPATLNSSVVSPSETRSDISRRVSW